MPSNPTALCSQFMRMLSNHSASLLFCPRDTAVRNLAAENGTRAVHSRRDTMFDAVLVLVVSYLSDKP